ncbi:MAG: serine hydrolase [Kordiimonadaceae bacterium]|nr:serine hydrolase [Kordiimonadaceae bacterium]
MSDKSFIITVSVFFLSLFFMVGCAEKQQDEAQSEPSVISEEFRSASSVSQTRDQIARLRKDDIWWTVNGRDMAWNNKNLHRFMPTVNLYREGQVKTLNDATNPEIPAFKIETPEGPIAFEDFLSSDYTTNMAVVILHKGKIAYEAYPRQEPYEKPVFWSVAKVYASSIIAILEDRGEIDVSKSIDHYISELKGSAFEGVSIRNVLDMATGIECAEEYVDKESCYYRYSMSVGDGFYDESSPDNPYQLLASITPPRYAEQGTDYQYSGANTFLLSWLIEEVTGLPYQDAVSKEIWNKIGAESDGSFLAPRYGVPITHGGLLARPRDVARFGLLFTPSYKTVSDEKIISDRYINLIKSGGNERLFDRYRSLGRVNDEIKYPVYQWDMIYTNNDFYKSGWAGQGLLVNPDKDTVVVYTGYFNDDQSEMDMLPVLRGLMNSIYPDAD